MASSAIDFPPVLGKEVWGELSDTEASRPTSRDMEGR